MYEGDLVIWQEVVLAEIVTGLMPTAIARIYTPGGFVIAADGLSTNSDTGEVINRSLQKIFRMGNSPLAMSFIGAARLNDGEFDFIEEVLRASQIISARRFQGLQQYADRIAGLVQRKLMPMLPRRATPLPSIPSMNPQDYGQTILIVHLDGYHNDCPDRVRIRFCHDGNRLLRPHILTEDVMPETLVLSGIDEIGRRILKRDPALLHYIREVKVEQAYPPSLLNAITMSRAVVEACGGPEARLVDPERAAAIGGDTHVAVITPDRGFQWAIKPRK